MLQNLITILASPWVEIGILILLLLLIALFALRKGTLLVSGIWIVRLLTLLLIFFYLMFVWISAIRPVLSNISIFGMFLINVVLFFHLVLARLERLYNKALAVMTAEPDKHELVDRVWDTGKRYYYLRYGWSSLVSGVNPFRFLRELAIERVRDDIKDNLQRQGAGQRMISLDTMVAYLKNQVSGDGTLPADFRNLMLQTIDDFAKHPYIQEQVSEFLRLVMERPEDLYFPEWMAEFEAHVNPSR